ncbi:MAG TPA: GerMN domain-containing protein [Candidatus Eremiobacteraeota bacterium]|nr:MAG: Sporulation and spore germination [bacterium ADurb.Bin363]HPZ09069.1 GerMN domain-containing protein [Candidatus Eremiobacteraeota bacterium]
MLTSLKNKTLPIISITVFILLLSGCKIFPTPSSHNRYKVIVYFADINLMFLVPVTYYITEKSIGPREALNCLVSSETPDKNLCRLFPVDTDLLGFEMDKDGIASINFSANFKKAFACGGTEGNLLLSSINYTLSHFKEVKGIKLLIEGKRVDLLGDLDLKGNLPIERWKNLFLTGKESRVLGEDNRATLYLLEPNTSLLVPVTCVFRDSKQLPLLAIQHLSRGLDEEWASPTLPAGTEVLSFNVKNDIGYIDLNSTFLNLDKNISPEIVINSLSFTITEFDHINGLHITVEGKDLQSYSSMKLPSILSRPGVINELVMIPIKESCKEVKTWFITRCFFEEIYL